MPRSWDYKRVKTWVFCLVVFIGRDELSIHVQPLMNGEASNTITETQVTDYKGKNTSLYDNSEVLHLQWFIKPKNATLYFTKCYHGHEMNLANYFFTYAFTLEGVDRQTDLGNRTSHDLFYEGDKAVFQLNISQPRSSDAGFYTCLMHAAGTPQERTARLYVKRVRGVRRPKTVASVTSSSGYLPSDATQEVSDEDDSTFQGFQIAAIVLSVILFLVMVLVGVYCYRTKGSVLLLKARDYIRRNKKKQVPKLINSVHVPLCHGSEDTNIPNQDMSNARAENI